MKTASMVLASVVALASWGCSGSDPGDGAREAGQGGVLEPRSPGAEPDAPRGAGDELVAVREAGDGEPPNTGEVREVTPEEARAIDLALIAETNGWTLEEAELYLAKSDALSEVTAQVNLERPDVFVGAAVGPEPSDAPRLYIKGPADARILELAASAPFEIRVIDQQPYSRDELDQRQSSLAAELLALGFRNFILATDIEREGLMLATLQRQPGLPDSAESLLVALPPALRERISIEFTDEPAYQPEAR